MRIHLRDTCVDRRSTQVFFLSVYAALFGTACSHNGLPEGARAAPAQARPYVAVQPLPVSAVSTPDLARGGRLFDSWDKVLASGFIPDNPLTTAIDGRGGPFGDGRLLDANKQPMPNPGHDYRFVKLFGSDLRGAQGAFAHCGTGTPFVLTQSFMDNTDDAVRWRARFTAGEGQIPAFGNMLDARDIIDVVAFMLAVRDGQLPQPAAIFRMIPGETCRVERVPGGNALAGKALHAAQCSSCHGADGTTLPLGGSQFTLGQFARGRMHEAWYVILSGKADSAMQGLIDTLPRAQLADGLTDLFAAYADEAAFPSR